MDDSIGVIPGGEGRGENEEGSEYFMAGFHRPIMAGKEQRRTQKRKPLTTGCKQKVEDTAGVVFDTPRTHCAWLLNFTAEAVDQITSFAWKWLVTNLETVQKAYANKLTLWSKGQRVITQFFQRVHLGE